MENYFNIPMDYKIELYGFLNDEYDDLSLGINKL